MQIINSVPVWGSPVDEGALQQIVNCQKEADSVALMGDHHLGYSVPIGGVVAYKDAISPSGVGYDIGCGNKAVLTDMPGDELRKRIVPIMDEIWKTISFGMGRNNQEKIEHPLFDEYWEGWLTDPARSLKQMAQNQLGTVGGGNHYVDLFTDERDRVWIGVHFGSRGLGHKLATYFLKAGGAKDGIHEYPLVFPVGSDLGAQYISAMILAGEYAYAGRDWVCSRVAQILGAKEVEQIHNHHNYAWKENHGTREDPDYYWVVRKGATPAFPGQKGFVGGSMGDISVILEGVDHPEAALAMHSTVHGAGRALGRKQATGVYDKKKGEWKREPLITPQMMRSWIQEKNVELRGADVDESPHCYKRLPEVLEHHKNTIRILHTLTPVGVAMASKDIFDPFKD